MSTPIVADVYAPYNNQAAFEDTWRDMFGSWFGDGVIAGVDNELLVYGDSTPGRISKVKTGRARVVGTHGRWKSENAITHDPNTSSNPRIDRVIVRAKLSSATIPLLADLELDVLPGTAASSPTPPALTRTASTIEIPLAQVACAAGFSAVGPGDVTLERALLGGYAFPSFDDTDARDLWVPAPLAGYAAASRADGGLYVYDGSVWQQALRQGFSVAYKPSGNESTATFTEPWPNGLVVHTVVPKWASKLTVRAKLGQILNSATTAVTLQLRIDGIDCGDPHLISSPATTIPRDIEVIGQMDPSALADGGSYQVDIRVATSTGALVASAASACYLEGSFS